MSGRARGERIDASRRARVVSVGRHDGRRSRGGKHHDRLGGPTARIVAFVVAGALALSAAAQGAPRRVGLRWEGGAPRVSFSVRDLVDDEGRKKLRSGLPQTLELVVTVTRAGGRTLAVEAIQCRVVYDLWSERYRIERRSSERDETLSSRSVDAVMSACLEAKDLRVGRAADYADVRDAALQLAVRADLNPLSAQTLARIRRWLARPGGSIESDAFFGSFASRFVDRRVGEAERSVRFRSQVFSRANEPARRR